MLRIERDLIDGYDEELELKIEDLARATTRAGSVSLTACKFEAHRLVRRGVLCGLP